MKKRHAGFTLIEIMIALVIFAIIGVLAALSLHQTIENNKALNIQDQRLMQLQLALTLIRRDIIQAINRPVISADGGKTAAFTGSGSSIQLTRAGLINPFDVSKRTDMQRVGYALSKGSLVRQTWVELDRAPNAKPESQTLLNDVTSLEWKFIDRKHQTQSSWPASSNDAQQLPEPLPRAVLLTMHIKNEGEIDGVFPVPAQGGVSATTDTTDPTP